MWLQSIIFVEKDVKEDWKKDIKYNIVKEIDD